MGNRVAVTCSTTSLAVVLAPAVVAPAWAADAKASSDEWRFGIGTGFSSFSLDGDLGFATSVGGLIQDIDLSNSETSDLVQSGFGLGGFARNEQWTILWSAGQQTLEDQDSGLDAKWDRTQAEIAAVYKIGVMGANSFGVLFGARYTRHDWDIKTRGPGSRELSGRGLDRRDPRRHSPTSVCGKVVLEQSGGLWIRRFQDGTTFASTNLTWQPFVHWAFNLSAQILDTNFGDKSDINKSDFYYYDVKQPQFGVGFAYVW